MLQRSKDVNPKNGGSVTAFGGRREQPA